MPLFLKSYQKRHKIIRAFIYSNVHQVPSTIEKITLFYTVKKDIALKPLLRFASLLELVTTQRSFFIRARNASVFLKIRKGAPLGVKVTLRNVNLQLFILKLVWEVIPSIKNFRFKIKLNSIKTSFLSSLIMVIPDPLVFPVLKNFYFFFKSCTNLRMSFSFPRKAEKEEIFLNLRLSQIPCM
jgi:hypothetical protein